MLLTTREDSIIEYNTVVLDRYSTTLRIRMKGLAVKEFNHASNTIIF